MLKQSTIHEYISNLDKALSQEEKLHLCTKGLLELFPIQEAHLFRYAPLGNIVEGIIKINTSGLYYIGHVRDDLRNLPPINTSLRKRRAMYISNEEFFEKYGSKYTNPNERNDHFIIPICFSSNPVGYFIGRELNTDFTSDENFLTILTLYGKLVGEIIETNKEGQSIGKLSKRESEVMQRISWGESIKEMANSMEISEYTVKDYIKSAIKKLEVNNRVEAVAELLRKGFIS
ncbi:LuxR C-terminal-related transcriptional regulator [Alkalihalobacillus sp. MEB130]|uniref:LuxR C-terminal-related transcriptional regulator n=1 Tax=Alkalihalobacillus sp. MEB130 TaxID=2976704 RepID=UPI0028DF5110|nr:LuxR C-terminal-related transcriptional regulator [Alkalihalobacillus sp. MEB130]MDT8860260.1 LuxR C-terminal-related transcriptional regulator [Alkalihalobacillus sp. MEB130]